MRETLKKNQYKEHLINQTFSNKRGEREPYNEPSIFYCCKYNNNYEKKRRQSRKVYTMQLNTNKYNNLRVERKRKGGKKKTREQKYNNSEILFRVLIQYVVNTSKIMYLIHQFYT